MIDTRRPNHSEYAVRLRDDEIADSIEATSGRIDFNATGQVVAVTVRWGEAVRQGVL